MKKGGIRKWLIRKLGGYDEKPWPEIKYIIREREQRPVTFAVRSVCYTWPLCDEEYEWIKRDVVSQLVQKILDSGLILFQVETQHSATQTVDARITVVPPDGWIP